MIEYTVKDFSPNTVVVTRNKDREPKVQGLPPKEKQSIFFSPDEIDQFIKTLEEARNYYGNK
jgi:hypothetical protein